MALGESVVRDGRFIHQFQPQDAPGFNTTHYIHELSFGMPYPGLYNPLDKVGRLVLWVLWVQWVQWVQWV